MADRVMVSVDTETFEFPDPVIEVLDKRYQTVMTAGANGVAGDGVADDSAALNALLVSAAALGAGVRLEAGSTVLAVASPIMVPTGTRLDLNGAKIKSALPNSTSRLVIVQNASNVLIENGVLDGDKVSFTPVTEQRHNLHIIGSSSVTIRDVRSINAKGDGVYVGDQNGLSRDVYLENVTCDQNWRNGMSISHVSGLTAVACEFSNTAGTNPQAGVDVEPNSGTVACEDVRFIACAFKGNGHFGFLVSLQASATARQGGIDLVGCVVSGNGTANDSFGGGVNLREAKDVTIAGGSVWGNTGPGVLIDHNSVSENVTLADATIRTNSTHGVYATQAVLNLTIEGCTIKGNGTAAATTYDGINLSPSTASSSVRVIGTVSTGASQRYGLITSSNVSGLTSIGNDYAGNGSAPTALSDDRSTRTQVDTIDMSLSTRLFWWTAAAATVQSFRIVGDPFDRLQMNTDGRLLWGSGSAAADVQLSRLAAGVVGTASNQALRTGVQATGARPSAVTVGKGSQFYDSTLSKPIWSDGTNWRDAVGTVV